MKELKKCEYVHENARTEAVRKAARKAAEAAEKAAKIARRQEKCGHPRMINTPFYCRCPDCGYERKG